MNKFGLSLIGDQPFQNDVWRVDYYAVNGQWFCNYHYSFVKALFEGLFSIFNYNPKWLRGSFSAEETIDKINK